MDLVRTVVCYFVYTEPKIREPFHVEVFFILHIKDMESKPIPGVTSSYYLQ